MPGSPPTNVAEPGTSPPPATRSNSPMPETKRFSSVGEPDSATKSILRPPPATLFGSASPTASSTIEFHAPQSSHLPDHLRCTAPQVWQTKREVGGLAMPGRRLFLEDRSEEFGGRVEQRLDLAAAPFVGAKEMVGALEHALFAALGAFGGGVEFVDVFREPVLVARHHEEIAV